MSILIYKYHLLTEPRVRMAPREDEPAHTRHQTMFRSLADAPRIDGSGRKFPFQGNFTNPPRRCAPAARPESGFPPRGNCVRPPCSGPGSFPLRNDASGCPPRSPAHAPRIACEEARAVMNENVRFINDKVYGIDEQTSIASGLKIIL